MSSPEENGSKAASPMAQHSIPMPAAATEGPDESQQQLMDSLGITFRDGAYHLGDFRYGRLADAANFARLRRTQGIS